MLVSYCWIIRVKLQNGYEIFTSNFKSLHSSDSVPGNPWSPRWLLFQLVLILKHQIAYTCQFKKHGTILYRPGRELDCLSHSLFCHNKCKENKLDYVEVCPNLNARIRSKREKSRVLNGLVDIDHLLILFCGIWFAFWYSQSERVDKVNKATVPFTPNDVLHWQYIFQAISCTDSRSDRLSWCGIRFN